MCSLYSIADLCMQLFTAINNNTPLALEIISSGTVDINAKVMLVFLGTMKLI